jgi:membrane associated rhomboid family serine protease
MIPLRDVIPSRTTPWVTLFLIAVNAVVFATMAVLSEEHRREIIGEYGLLPGRWSWMTATTSMFVHAGSLHVAGNLAALWLFGENVEDRFGHVRYLAFYAALGYVAGLAELWAAPNGTAPLVGASGAIAGIMGAYLVMFPRSRLLVAVPTGVPPDLAEVPAFTFAAGWFLLHVAAGLGRPWGGTTLVALFAGTAVGVAATAFLRRPERQRVEWWAQ